MREGSRAAEAAEKRPFTDGGSRWRRLGLLTGVLVISSVLQQVGSSVGTRARPASIRGAPAGGTAIAAGTRGDGADAGSRYRSHCASCHGPGGQGDGWTGWILRLKMRDLSDAGYVETLSDDYLFRIIKQGGANLGKPGMPSWGQELTDLEIREMVAYLRGLAASRPPDQPAGTAR